MLFAKDSKINITSELNEPTNGCAQNEKLGQITTARHGMVDKVWILHVKSLTCGVRIVRNVIRKMFVEIF